MPPFPVRLVLGIAFVGGGWYVRRRVRRVLRFQMVLRPDRARALRGEAVIVNIVAALMALTGLAFLLA